MSTANHGNDRTADLERRFGGLARLYGVAGAACIRRAHIAVAGIGGVGSWVAEALARSGVGALTLIDLDHVAESNVNRQVHALTDTLGLAKVEAMAARIAQIHPGCRVRTIDEFVTPDNWPALLEGEPVDAVIDACDQVAAKVAMAAWALRTQARFITIGAAGGKRCGEEVQIADLAEATHDPLLAELRRRLRHDHGAAKTDKSGKARRIGIAVVFSREPVARPDACDAPTPQTDGSLNCHGYGSTVSVTATFGLIAAGWTLDRIAQD
ncbi:MAG: tRNA threonylcarbamoyladenosine dehydratase [Burkholderiaceae bacterium]|jgi:tRNA A37 threonylcarbamoyladenosine dehydratase|nr:tRNA threonylcarbamoyladenosine dehydratase [Burkholderiaceae bacterium]